MVEKLSPNSKWVTYRAGARKWYKRAHARLLRRLAKQAIQENDNPTLVTRATRGYAD